MINLESTVARIRARRQIRTLARESGSRWTAALNVDRQALNDRWRVGFRQQCEVSVSRFRQVVDSDWTERSILMSEGLAICAMCDLFAVDMLIESGTYNGRSTDIFARYLPQACPIHSIDIEVRDEARRRLATHSNVTLHEGDSRSRMLELLGDDAARVGVFIDGPKGRAAVRMAIDALNRPAVAFVAIHDMNRTRADGKRRARGRELFDAVMPLRLTTDEDWFVEAYQDLDVEEGGRDLSQRLQWAPYGYRDTETGIISRQLGSYGPTVAFAALAPLPPMARTDQVGGDG